MLVVSCTVVADRKRVHAKYWHPIAVVGIANERGHDEKGDGGFGRPGATSEAFRESWQLGEPSPIRASAYACVLHFTRASGAR
jgi:hypothetical protein